MRLADVLRQKGTDQQRSMVQARIADAEAMLTLVRDTFPTYTRHDRVHAENVVKLTESLLGDDGIQRLSALEAAVLLLASYYHDVGMVVKKSELQGIAGEPEFQEFLRGTPSAFVDFQLAGGSLTAELAESYCRWRHADRVHIRLNEISDDDLMWDGVPLRSTLIDVCRSHNMDAARLDQFMTDFLGECDLRLCAVLLRLADILDFDSSRAPKILYDHLNLERGGSRSLEFSDTEWKKHLASAGFRFPGDPRADRYVLYFGAGPRIPRVEFEIRRFLDLIEKEIAACRVVVAGCAAHWRDLALPSSVDRRGIQSIGYKYGDFRFELDRRTVLQLFMGDRLYSDDDAVVRELLQNAIDATRTRCVLNGLDATDEAYRIAINSWRDSDGFDWLRVDDSGIGMDESTVSKYLLQVGKSYYSSVDFEADLIRARADRNAKITPISRFGIGILSCFQWADQVEISTRRSLSNGLLGDAIRLTLPGLHEFFSVQSGNLQADPMPCRQGLEPGYRNTAGTSVALRIDPTKVGPHPVSLTTVKKFVFASPVPISFNGSDVTPQLGQEVADQIGAAGTFHLDRDDLSKFEILLGGEAMPQLELLPLDLTANSPVPELSGQLIAITARFGDEEAADARRSYPEIYGRSSRLARAMLARILDGEESTHGDIISVLARYIDARPSLSIKNSGHLELRVRWDPEGDTVVNLQRLLQGVEDGDPDKVERSLPRFYGLDDEAQRSLDRLKETGRLTPSRLRGVADSDSLVSAAIKLLRVMDRSGSQRGRYATDVTVSVPLSRVLSPTVKISEAGPQFSHNGIVFPMNERRTGNNSATVSVAAGWGQAVLLGGVALADRLRPDLNVARDSTIKLGFATRSAVLLATIRAAKSQEGRGWPALVEAVIARLDPTDPGYSEREMLNLAEIEADPLMIREDGWQQERIFGPSGNRLSVIDIRESLVGERLTQYVTFSSFLGGLRDVIRRSLVQRHLDVGYSYLKSYDRHFVLRSQSVPITPPGLVNYPPLLFVPYENESCFSRADSPINLGHPLAQWAINGSERLAAIYPAALARLRKAMVAVTGSLNRNESVPQLVEVLQWIGRDIRVIDPPPMETLELAAAPDERI